MNRRASIIQALEANAADRKVDRAELEFWASQICTNPGVHHHKTRDPYFRPRS